MPDRKLQIDAPWAFETPSQRQDRLADSFASAANAGLNDLGQSTKAFDFAQAQNVELGKLQVEEENRAKAEALAKQSNTWLESRRLSESLRKQRELGRQPTPVPEVGAAPDMAGELRRRAQAALSGPPSERLGYDRGELYTYSQGGDQAVGDLRAERARSSQTYQNVHDSAVAEARGKGLAPAASLDLIGQRLSGAGFDMPPPTPTPIVGGLGEVAGAVGRVAATGLVVPQAGLGLLGVGAGLLGTTGLPGTAGAAEKLSQASGALGELAIKSPILEHAGKPLLTWALDLMQRDWEEIALPLAAALTFPAKEGELFSYVKDERAPVLFLGNYLKAIQEGRHEVFKNLPEFGHFLGGLVASGIIKSRVPLDLAINDIGGPEELKRRIEEAKHAYEAAPESMPGRKFVMQAAVDPLTWVPVTLLKAPGLGLKAGFEATVKAAETGPRLIRPLASAAVKVIDMGGETFSNLYTIYRVDPVNYKELLEMIRRRGRMPGVIWADEMRENLHIYGRASGAFGLRGRRGVVSGTYGLTPEQAVAVGDVNSTWLEDLIQEKPWMFKAESVGLSPEAGALTFDDLVDPTVRDIAKYLKEVKGPVVEAYKLAVDPNIKFVAGPYQHRYFAETLKQSIREAMSPGLGWRKPGFTYRRQEQVVESGLLKDPQLVVALDSASARLAFENAQDLKWLADIYGFRPGEAGMGELGAVMPTIRPQGPRPTVPPSMVAKVEAELQPIIESTTRAVGQQLESQGLKAVGEELPGIQAHVQADLVDEALTGGIDKPVPIGREIPSPDAVPTLAGVSTGKRSVSELEIHPAEMQFRVDVDPRTGVRRAIGTQTWDPIAADRLVVWDRLDGSHWVVDGHHRVELARRTDPAFQFDTVNLSEAEGWTLERVRGRGALLNMQQRTASEMDIAKFFRSTGTTAQELRTSGLDIREGQVVRGQALSQLSDAGFERVVTGRVTGDRAVLIGAAKLAPDDQLKAMDWASKGRGRSPEDLALYLEEARIASTVTHTQTTLFGETVLEKSTMEARLKIRKNFEAWLRGNKRAQESAAGHWEYLQTRGRTQIDVGELRAGVLKDDQALEVFSTLAGVRGLVREALDDLAAKLTEGANDAAIYAEARSRIPQAIDEQFRQGFKEELPVSVVDTVGAGAGPLPEPAGPAALRGLEQAPDPAALGITPDQPDLFGDIAKLSGAEPGPVAPVGEAAESGLAGLRTSTRGFGTGTWVADVARASADLLERLGVAGRVIGLSAEARTAKEIAEAIGRPDLIQDIRNARIAWGIPAWTSANMMVGGKASMSPEFAAWREAYRAGRWQKPSLALPPELGPAPAPGSILAETGPMADVTEQVRAGQGVRGPGAPALRGPLYMDELLSVEDKIALAEAERGLASRVTPEQADALGRALYGMDQETRLTGKRAMLIFDEAMKAVDFGPDVDKTSLFEQFIRSAGFDGIRTSKTLPREGTEWASRAIENLQESIRRNYPEAAVPGPIRVELRPTSAAAAPGTEAITAGPPISAGPTPEQLQAQREMIFSRQAVLPGQLAGATPRYSFGSKQFKLVFEDDLEKAAYITAQKTPSKMNEAYLAFVQEHLGVSRQVVEEWGRTIRERIKGMARDARGERITVKASPGARPLPPELAPSVKGMEQAPAVGAAPQTFEDLQRAIGPETPGTGGVGATPAEPELAAQGRFEPPPGGPPGYRPMTLPPSKPGGAPETVWMPNDILDAINNFLDPVQRLAFLRGFDALQAIAKVTVTQFFPDYHARNLTSNYYRAVLDGVWNPAHWGDAARVLYSIRYPESKFAVKSININRKLRLGLSEVGPNVTPYEFLQLANEYGGINAGWLGAHGEIADLLKGINQHFLQVEAPNSVEYLKAMQPGKLSRFLSAAGTPGQYLENWSRMGHLLGRLDKGDDFLTAVSHVRKFQVDYQDLTQIERQLFRRAAYFYTYVRKALPLEFDQLVKGRKVAGIPIGPNVRNLARAQQEIQEMFDPEGKEAYDDLSLFDRWVFDRLNFGLGRDENGNPRILYATGLPVEYLNMFVKDDAVRTIDNFANLAFPLWKALPELFGHSFFTHGRVDNPSFGNLYGRGPGSIAAVPGLRDWLEMEAVEIKDPKTGKTRTVYNVDTTKMYLFMNFFAGASRLFQSLEQAGRSDYTTGERLANLVTGAKTTTIDIQRRQQQGFGRSHVAAYEKYRSDFAILAKEYYAGQTVEGEPLPPQGMWQRRKALRGQLGTELAQADKELELAQPAQYGGSVEERQAARLRALPAEQQQLAELEQLNPEEYREADGTIGWKAYWKEHDRLLTTLSPEQQAVVDQREKDYLDRLGPPGSQARELEMTIRAALEVTKQIADLPDYVAPGLGVADQELEDRINKTKRELRTLGSQGGPGSERLAKVRYINIGQTAEERAKRTDDIKLVIASERGRWRNPEILTLRQENADLLNEVFGEVPPEELARVPLQPAS